MEVTGTFVNVFAQVVSCEVPGTWCDEVPDIAFDCYLFKGDLRIWELSQYRPEPITSTDAG